MSGGGESGGQKPQPLWVAGVLLATAAFLVLGPLAFRSPVGEPAAVADWVTDTTPVRSPAMAPLFKTRVYTFKCSECHKVLPSPPETLRTLTQHTDIKLQHGINTRCFNCHHPKNRDAFIDDLGDEIPWDQPQLVCAKCHGPVYRDWQHGSHGRSNGYWDAEQGEQTRRKCIECHDPHHPPFQRMQPAPGPSTLRMGPQDVASDDHSHNPLMISQQSNDDRAGNGESEGGH
ncbi:hypothetical protein Poly41_02620 [Novipirellula artificiosorum]|uniref:Uncharacterized protein n=2 Tax=Novipirellula artificiosorum TaxID=2528016 RepID=A0A5C6E3G5_9BACT|nr:hypothetical protein Poly41_02620 [Novipirellula artificiosorum]